MTCGCAAYELQTPNADDDNNFFYGNDEKPFKKAHGRVRFVPDVLYGRSNLYAPTQMYASSSAAPQCRASGSSAFDMYARPGPCSVTCFKSLLTHFSCVMYASFIVTLLARRLQLGPIDFNFRASRERCFQA